MWMLRIKKQIFSDERSLQTYRHIGSKMYALTVWLLIIDMIYRNHVLNQSYKQDYWDIGAILLIPGVIYIGANLYYGGILPIRFKQAALRIYVSLVAVSLIVGVINGQIIDFVSGFEIFVKTSVMILLVIGGYYIFVYAGKRNLGD